MNIKLSTGTYVFQTPLQKKLQEVINNSQSNQLERVPLNDTFVKSDKVVNANISFGMKAYIPKYKRKSKLSENTTANVNLNTDPQLTTLYKILNITPNGNESSIDKYIDNFKDLFYHLLDELDKADANEKSSIKCQINDLYTNLKEIDIDNWDGIVNKFDFYKLNNISEIKEKIDNINQIGQKLKEIKDKNFDINLLKNFSDIVLFVYDENAHKNIIKKNNKFENSNFISSATKLIEDFLAKNNDNSGITTYLNIAKNTFNIQNTDDIQKKLPYYFKENISTEQKLNALISEVNKFCLISNIDPINAKKILDKYSDIVENLYEKTIDINNSDDFTKAIINLISIDFENTKKNNENKYPTISGLYKKINGVNYSQIKNDVEEKIKFINYLSETKLTLSQINQLFDEKNIFIEKNDVVEKSVIQNWLKNYNNIIDEIQNDLNIKIDIKKDNIDIIFTLLYSDTFKLNNDEFLIPPKETYAQTLYNKDINEVVEKVFNKNFKEIKITEEELKKLIKLMQFDCNKFSVANYVQKSKLDADKIIDKFQTIIKVIELKFNYNKKEALTLFHQNAELFTSRATKLNDIISAVKEKNETIQNNIISKENFLNRIEKELGIENLGEKERNKVINFINNNFKNNEFNQKDKKSPDYIYTDFVLKFLGKLKGINNSPKLLEKLSNSLFFFENKELILENIKNIKNVKNITSKSNIAVYKVLDSIDFNTIKRYDKDKETFDSILLELIDKYIDLIELEENILSIKNYSLSNTYLNNIKNINLKENFIGVLEQISKHKENYQVTIDYVEEEFYKNSYDKIKELWDNSNLEEKMKFIDFLKTSSNWNNKYIELHGKLRLLDRFILTLNEFSEIKSIKELCQNDEVINKIQNFLSTIYNEIPDKVEKDKVEPDRFHVKYFDENIECVFNTEGELITVYKIEDSV